jgi:hypothetical protein
MYFFSFIFCVGYYVLGNLKINLTRELNGNFVCKSRVTSRIIKA